MRGFVAIDFETATLDRYSACAIGGVVVEYVDGDEWKVIDSFHELIRPPDVDPRTSLPVFDEFNVSIHGITPEMVKHAPTFDTVWQGLLDKFEDRLLLAHNTRFDMFVVLDACAKYGIEVGSFPFACSYRLARAAWPTLPTYRLDSLADLLSIELQHHNALSDAVCAAGIAQQIVKDQGVSSIEEAAERLGFRLGLLSDASYRPFSNAKSTEYPAQSTKRLSQILPTGEIPTEHPLKGKRLCFTGTLTSMSREEAAQRAVNAGGTAADNVSSKVDYLVVGVTDLRLVKDGASGKLRKAIEMRQGGHHIEIIDEEDFLRLLS